MLKLVFKKHSLFGGSMGSANFLVSAHRSFIGFNLLNAGEANAAVVQRESSRFGYVGLWPFLL